MDRLQFSNSQRGILVALQTVNDYLVVSQKWIQKTSILISSFHSFLISLSKNRTTNVLLSWKLSQQMRKWNIKKWIACVDRWWSGHFFGLTHPIGRLASETGSGKPSSFHSVPTHLSGAACCSVWVSDWKDAQFWTELDAERYSMLLLPQFLIYFSAYSNELAISNICKWCVWNAQSKSMSRCMSYWFSGIRKEGRRQGVVFPDRARKFVKGQLTVEPEMYSRFWRLASNRGQYMRQRPLWISPQRI